MSATPNEAPVQDAVEDALEDAVQDATQEAAVSEIVADVAADVAEDAAEEAEEAAEEAEEAAEEAEEAAEEAQEAAAATDWQLSVERRLTEQGLAIAMLAGAQEEQAENVDALAQDMGSVADAETDAIEDASPETDTVPNFDNPDDEEEPKVDSWFFRPSKRKRRK